MRRKFKNADEAYNYFHDKIITDGKDFGNTRALFNVGFTLENPLENYIFNIQINFSILKERILKRSSEESRDDDKIDVIETRYNEYINSTQKVSNFYKDKYSSIFYEIDGSLQINEITEKIKQIIKKSWKSAKILDIFSWLNI